MSAPPPPHVPQPTVAIQGSDARFPVGRILCIGRNYAAHAREMGASGREAPFHFVKSPPSLLPADGPAELVYPPQTQDLHHELELVVALGAGGAQVDPADAPALIYGYALGLDMTRRDLQNSAKAGGKPWSSGKDFDGAAVCGPIVPAGALGHPSEGPVRLHVNGALRQSGDLTELIWSIPELLAELSRLMTLRAGDLIYTGTPSGVGPVVPGDVLEGSFPGLPALVVTITAPAAG